MNLKQEIKVNPKITKTIIMIFCILGIFHELLLAVTRLAMTFWMSEGIIFTIGNNYSNTIWSDAVALFFRLFIFFAVIFVYSDHKAIKRMAKGLALTKILYIAFVLSSISWWINITMTQPMDTWDYYRDTSRIVKTILSYILIFAEFALFAALINKSKEKVRTIFILMFIASLLEKYAFLLSDLMYRFTPFALDGFIFFAASVLFIICFIKAMSIVKTKCQELDKIDKKYYFLNMFYTDKDEV